MYMIYECMKFDRFYNNWPLTQLSVWITEKVTKFGHKWQKLATSGKSWPLIQLTVQTTAKLPSFIEFY